MAYTVGNLKQDLTGMAHGTTLNQITGLDQLIYRAARELLMDVDPQETIRVLPFTSPVFQNVFDYALAPDVKGISIIDIFPQVNRAPGQIYSQSYAQQFSLLSRQSGGPGINPNFNISFNTGLKYIKVNDPFSTAQIIVNQASSPTNNNGTWTATGNASNLETDNVNWVNGGSSIQFDLADTGPIDPSFGGLENSTMTAVDLTEQLNQGWFFIWTYLPTGADFNEVLLRWGSSSTDYYSQSVTQTQQGTAFQNGWNLLGFEWKTANVTGSPDFTAINYVLVEWDYIGTLQTAVRLNDITVQNGTILNYMYYSKYLFRDASTGAFQETVTDNSNIINLDTESYNLLTYLTGLLVSQQQQGKNALLYDSKFMQDKYDKALMKYKLRYKSQIQKPQTMYYRPNNPGYNGAGRVWWPM